MDRIEKIILDYFSFLSHIVSISLFGSFAGNTANRESDVDIAILCEKAHIPSVLTLIEWRESLSSALEKDVDLVCLNTASPIIGMQVFKHGKTLKIRNPREYANYQMLLFSDYAELKDLRTPMEKNILKRKYYDRS